MNSFLPDPSRLDSVWIGFFFAALACLVVGLLWLSTLALIALTKGWKRARWPLGLILVGLVLAAIPLLWTRFGGEVLDLGPRERVVDGERHLTLTGWDRPASDYEILRLRPDTVVLQTANPDVTDEVVENLAGMDRLSELDLTDTGISDAGLATLARLPSLKKLRLSRTRITDEGFRKHLMDKESIEQLDVRGTALQPETIEAWKGKKAGRRALGP